MMNADNRETAIKWSPALSGTLVGRALRALRRVQRRAQQALLRPSPPGKGLGRGDKKFELFSIPDSSENDPKEAQCTYAFVKR